MLSTQVLGVTFITRTLESFAADLQAAAPKILSGVVFLVLAAVLIKIAMFVVKSGLQRALPGQDVYQAFAATIVVVFLWFGVALTFLSIIGLDGIATALGTASGFLALGVSYALSSMIADSVAGIYLLRDPDFNEGDKITAGDMTGTVQAIELRKTRFEVDGDTVVRANAEVEKRWTRRTATESTDPSV